MPAQAKPLYTKKYGQGKLNFNPANNSAKYPEIIDKNQKRQTKIEKKVLTRASGGGRLIGRVRGGLGRNSQKNVDSGTGHVVKYNSASRRGGGPAAAGVHLVN